MIFRTDVLAAISSGDVTLAFRRWRRPTVRAGGTLLTAAGQLHIGAIARVTPAAITADDAHRAGYASREALLAELDARAEGDLYRVELGPLRPDPRIALRAAVATGEGEMRAILERLGRFDARAGGRPWTMQTLAVLHAHPGVRAGDICKLVGQERDAFKVNVRKLKALGLTESLEVGYRLSPRGRALLERLRGRA